MQNETINKKYYWDTKAGRRARVGDLPSGDQLLGRTELCVLLGCSRPSWAKLEHEAGFPPPDHIDGRTLKWLRSTIVAHMKARAEKLVAMHGAAAKARAGRGRETRARLQEAAHA